MRGTGEYPEKDISLSHLCHVQGWVFHFKFPKYAVISKYTLIWLGQLVTSGDWRLAWRTQSVPIPFPLLSLPLLCSGANCSATRSC